MATSAQLNASLYLADTDAPICRLDVKKHFDSLSDKEAKYAHYISQASWAATKALATTVSPEAPQLYDLFIELFTDPATANGPRRLHKDLTAWKEKSGVSEQVWTYFLEYAAQTLNNLGNYKSFGDTKFIPRLSASDFTKILQHSSIPTAHPLFQKLQERIYALTPESQLLIGFPAEGHITGYYSPNIGKQDVALVQSFLEKNNISPLNTRLFKSDSDGSYEVKIASAQISQPPKEYSWEGHKIVVTYGDFSEDMKSVAENLKKAGEFAANENQRKMMEAYVESFETGSIEAHKESQRHWIRDVGPTVESNIGYIETYRDPAGVRAEWEGFVAVVNKDMTKKFEKLVDGAPSFVPRLPWPKEFEKDKFNRPDFTSLEVLTFATSGTPPAGINIPNYDDIRQTFGFKNVSLGNVLNAKAAKEKVTFIRQEDLALYEKLRGEAFEVQVGLHELLGHGTGKLLQEESAGKFNFDEKNPPVNPLTGKPVTSWYKPGETWGSVFKATAASYEECRAESVAMFLCVDREILNIFGFKTKEEQDDIIYICYLQMARAGLLSMEFYDPKSRKWGQAHMQARFAILQVFLNAGLVEIRPTTSAAGNDLEIHLDRSKILSHGLPAVSAFLTELQIHKATADAENGVKFYEKWTGVPEGWMGWRDIVISRKQPRKVFLQGNTRVDEEGRVVLKEYEVGLEGFIESFVERAR
ncbi:hypothetical protein HK097_004145 [Rhizophlyctis rosea]|uniref:Dipeptidyl peptidase 3 n=1 Tax=Rhizophlyctis rosea TaxID=64517 RepID=A0AAD5SFM0_9FUNG|nr:hypothetical protein HK097_004145 [Rhizophlyctis rosea]